MESLGDAGKPIAENMEKGMMTFETFDHVDFLFPCMTSPL